MPETVPAYETGKRDRYAERSGKAFSAWMPRRDLVPRSFYAHSPDLVARKLLGKVLVRKLVRKGAASEPSGTRELAGRIVEVEAYFGDNDPAAHSFAGKTARNAVLFGPPGHAYVYFIYGMHFCCNVSCEIEGQAGCVLIRALQPLAGLDAMAKRRWPKTDGRPPRPSEFPRALTSGPGRVCQAFGITREGDNGSDFTSAHSTLQIQDDGFDDGFARGKVLVTPRIGIRKAVDRPARFVLSSSFLR